MSLEAMTAVWRHSQSEGRARLVLLAIADHFGEIGAWPSIATLAKMVNASERSVQRDIKTLEDLGELQVEEQAAPTRSQYKSNLYWILLPGVTETHSGVTNPVSGVTESQIRGDKNDVRGDTVVTQTITKPLLKKPLSKTSLDESFETFWKIYPRREKRARAFTIFERIIQTVPVETIIAGAEAYRDDPNRTKRFTRLPEIWLNNHCWLDDPQPPQHSSNDSDPWGYMEAVR